MEKYGVLVVRDKEVSCMLRPGIGESVMSGVVVSCLLD